MRQQLLFETCIRYTENLKQTEWYIHDATDKYYQKYNWEWKNDIILTSWFYEFNSLSINEK